MFHKTFQSIIFKPFELASFGFIDKVAKIGSDILGNAGDVISGVAGAYLGNKINPQQQQFSREDYGWQLGADRQSARKMERFNWDQAQARGLTAQEFYGSPAAGNTGTSSTSAVLGNSADTANQIQQQQNMEFVQRALDRDTQIEQSTIQADAQRDVAEINAGVQRRGQDINEQIQRGRLELDTRSFEEVAKPQAAEVLKLTEQQTLEQVNKVATSDPAFIRAMKVLTMSAENLVASILVNGQEIDPLDRGQLLKLSPEDRAQLLTTMVAMGSASFRESSGIQAKASEVLQVFLSASERKIARNAGKKPAEMSDAEAKAYIQKRHAEAYKRYHERNNYGDVPDHLGNQQPRKFNYGVEG